MLQPYRNATGGLVGNDHELEPSCEPDYSDYIAARISTLGFIKLRDLSRDYRKHGAKYDHWFGGFRGWLREMIDRQIDEEAAKDWDDREFFAGGY